MSFMQRLLGRAPAKSGRQRARRRRPLSPIGLQAAEVETLEDRALLSASPLPYATAANVSQLTADIAAANKAGGAITIKLASNTTFNLSSANNSANGGNGLPVISGSKGLNLTIVGNGDTIARVGLKAFRLIDVAPGASLTLDHVRLQGGYSLSGGGAIYNQGTLKVIDGSILSGNHAQDGGGIDNAGGTVTVSNSTLSGNTAQDGGGIENGAGVVTLANCALSGNQAQLGGGILNFATLTVGNSTLSGNAANQIYGSGGDGGGIANYGGSVTLNNSTVSGNSAVSAAGIYTYGGKVTVENSSRVTGNISNFPDEPAGDIYNNGVLAVDSTSTIGSLFGNPAQLI